MFGVTTPCVTAIRDQLESHYDALVFHATGTGGRAMEKLVGDGLVSAVLDITTTEGASCFATTYPEHLGNVDRARAAGAF